MLGIISPYSDISSIGVRMLSAVLRKAGVPVRLIFIPPERPELIDAGTSTGRKYPPLLEEALLELCRDLPVVGISLMTNYFFRAMQLTDALKRTGNRIVVWGGVHPTLKPDECLEFADMVCLGEGEETLLDLAGAVQSEKSVEGIKNLWMKKNGNLIRNPVRPPVHDLDTLPPLDYSLSDDFIWDAEKNSFLKMNEKVLRRYLAMGYISGIRDEVAYQTMASRGCPHNCHYCCAHSLGAIYAEGNYLRRRGVSHIISELKTIRERFGFVRVIGFSDDSFFMAGPEEIREFSRRYKEEIGLPFFCLGSPTTITRAKLESLIEAGLFSVQMGIQTGSGRTKELFNRTVSNEKILESARTISSFSHTLMPPNYDLIIDNPWESIDDILETFSLLLRLPRPHRLQLFSLVLFPGTPLFDRAVDEGRIRDIREEVYNREYHQRGRNYVNIVFALFRHNAPLPLLKVLGSRPVVKLFSAPPFNWSFAVAYTAYRHIRVLLHKIKLRGGT